MALARAVTPQRAVRLIPLCRRRQALLYGVSLNVPSCNGLRGALGEVCLPSRPPPRSRSLSSCTNTSYSAFFKHKKIGKNSHISLPSPPSYTAETGKALVCPFVLNRVTGLQATRPPPRTQLAGLRMFAETRTLRHRPHARPRQPPIRPDLPGVGGHVTHGLLCLASVTWLHVLKSIHVVACAGDLFLFMVR